MGKYKDTVRKLEGGPEYGQIWQGCLCCMKSVDSSTTEYLSHHTLQAPTHSQQRGKHKDIYHNLLRYFIKLFKFMNTS